MAVTTLTRLAATVESAALSSQGPHFRPTVLLFGSQRFRNYPDPVRGVQTLRIVRATLKRLAGPRRYFEVLENDFARPSDLMMTLALLVGDEDGSPIFVYYYGHATWDDHGSLWVAQPSSTPGRLRTHLKISEVTPVFGRRHALLVVDDVGGPTLAPHRPCFGDSKAGVAIRTAGPTAAPGPAGGDLITAQLARVLDNSRRYLPSLSLSQAFRILDRRLPRMLRGAFEIPWPGADATVRPFIRQVPSSGLWRSELENLESPNPGSREDGISQIAVQESRESRKEARFLLEVFSAVDPVSEVRSAASEALKPTRTVKDKRGVGRDWHSARFPEWIHIPAGFFVMGSEPSKDAEALPEEMPAEQVFLGDYAIGKFVVSCGEWAEFVESGAGPAPPGKTVEQLRAIPTYPVTRVNLYDASDYAEWLTEIGHRRGVLSSSELIRVPFESEWERAARGTKGLIYPWGRTFDRTRCNVRSSGY